MHELDLIELACKASENVVIWRQDSLDRYFGGNYNKVEQLHKFTNNIKDELSKAYNDPWKYKVAKEMEKGIKEGLCRLENLLREIETFQEEGNHPDMIMESFKISTSKEVDIILEELKPFSSKVCGSVPCDDVVGREYNSKKEQFIEMLMDSNSSPVIPILGKAGTGKSTLARLAFNDPRIKNHFNSMHYFNLSSATHQNLVKPSILYEVTEEDLKPGQESYLNRIQRCGRGQKSLLALDDLSDVEMLRSLLSDGEKHPLFYAFMKGAASGSKIIITSNLELEHVGLSAIIVPSLDKDESWNLFKKLALPEHERQLPVSFPAIQICLLCKNIPAVIKIIASILSGKRTQEEWKYFADVVMTSTPEPVTIITSTLQLRNRQRCLPTQTKWRRCFSWCSLLPKDYYFTKDCLVRLWRTQELYKEHKMTEDELDRCFDHFVKSGYFIKGEDSRATIGYKVTYLASELMKHVAGNDYCLVDNSTQVIDHHKIIRHISFVVDSSRALPAWLPKAKLLHSFLIFPGKSGDLIPVSKIESTLSRMNDLKVLHAEGVYFPSLPEFLCKLEKLKYLRLGDVYSVALPTAILVLHKLLDCDPQYFENSGDILHYDYLETQERLVKLIKFGGFKKLTIKCEELDRKYGSEETRSIMESVNGQLMILSSSDGHHNKSNSLNVRQTLKSLEVRCWKGKELPEWTINELSVFIRNLTSIKIANCDGCQELPAFNTLPHISSLQLWGLYTLVNIVIGDEKSEASSIRTFYPSLKYLVLCDLPEFKGWICTGEDDGQHELQYFFPLLSEAIVQSCPRLISIPLMPMLVSLKAVNTDAKFLEDLTFPQELSTTSTASTPMNNIVSSPGCSSSHHTFLQSLEIDGCKEIERGSSLSAAEKGIWRCLRYLHSLKLTNIPELVSLSIHLENCTKIELLSLRWLTNLRVLPEWIGQSSLFRDLTIHYCPKLTGLPTSHGNFSGLEQLDIQYCPRLSQFPKSFPSLKRFRVQENSRFEQILRASKNLEILEIDNCEEQDGDLQIDEGESSVGIWEGLTKLHSLKMSKMETFPRSLEFEQLSGLQHLVIQYFPKLTALPERLCTLSALQDLQILRCPVLIHFPRNFLNLKSLKHLEIRESPQLEIRCQKPDGENWTLIKHIPTIICGQCSE